MSMYYVFATEGEAQAFADDLMSEIVSEATALGWAVSGNTIVGRNAKTFAQVPAYVTPEWSGPIELQSGGWGVPTCRVWFPSTYSGIESGCSAPGLSDRSAVDLALEGSWQ